MYVQQGAPWGNSYNHHNAHYGHPTEFGYKDLIPLWQAENWDPDALVRLFRDNGARYIVPVAVHHDNFDLYQSTWQPWNSVNMGPRRDIVGEWKAAAERHGLRFGVSSHSSFSWWWFQTAHGSDDFGPLAGVPYDARLREADGVGTWWEGYDPWDLYTPLGRPDGGADYEWVQNWHRRTRELLDRYQPDLLYFDADIPFGDLSTAAYFYNQSQVWNDGRLEAVLNLKVVPEDMAPNSVVIDFEKGQSGVLRPHPWQIDTPFTEHWFYTPDQPESGELLVHILCDTVSKNGNLLLNVGLFPDGTIPLDQRRELEVIGDWLAVNGEAIFETRPWITYGEGPSLVPDGPFNQTREPLTPDDVRFTTRGDTLYAIFFGRPESGVIQIESLRPTALIDEVESVEMLGYAGQVEWEQVSTGLRVTVPQDVPEATAYSLRIMATAMPGTPGQPIPEGGPEPAFVVRQYPNPFSGDSRLFVRVPTREQVSVRVFDLQGRLVQEYAVNVEANVDTEIDLQMGGLATGMYVGHVMAGPYAEVLRLVKQGR
jgi:alpha-L-fucosidase